MVQPDFKMKFLSIINVMMTSSILFHHLAISNPCTNNIPNTDLNKMLEGVDITTVDQFPIVKSTDQTRKANILAFTCNQAQTMYDESSGIQYGYPDQIRLRVNELEKVRIDLLKTTKDIENVMSMDVGSDYRYQQFTSIDTASYKMMQNNIDKFKSITVTTVRFRNITFVNQNPELSSDAKSYIKRFLSGSFEANINAYVGFVNKFGTHYRKDGIFDGAMKQYMEINTDKQNKVFAQLILDQEMGKNPYTKAISMLEKIAIQKDFYYGGDDKFKSQTEFKKWRLSTKKNRWFYSTRLSPISEIVPNHIKNDMNTAIDVYLVRKMAIEYIKKHTNYKNIPIEYTNNMVYKFVITHGLYKHATIDAIAKKITSELNIPKWFLNTPRLCVKTGGKWCSNTGDCVKFNGRTKAFYDNSGKGSAKACVMRYRITSGGSVPKYFQNSKLCMRTKATGLLAKCDFRQRCAPVNKYIRYNDNPTTFYGYCALSWMIQVPNYSPIWLKNILFCFHWSPAQEARNCGGIKPTTCTSTGKWLPYYMDRTIGFEGSGCWFGFSWKLHAPNKQ